MQEFRARHGLVQIQGELLSDQQQSELASALVTASAEAAQIKARLDNFRKLLATGDVIAVSAMETLTPSDTALQQMRTEYLDSRRRWQAIAQSAGETHPQAARLKQEMDLTENAIAEELERAARAIEANYDVAQSRVASLAADLKAFSDGTGGDVRLMGQLAQLEAIAETYATVYRDYLERYEIATQQQDFPIASVSIISPAEMPLSPSSPQRKVMLGLGLLLGALVGMILAARREMGPPRLHTQKEVQDFCGLPCAGLLPLPAKTPSPLDHRVARRSLDLLRHDLDRASGGQAGRITALVPVESGGDPEALPSLARFLAAEGDRVLVINAGGIGPAMASRLIGLPNVELWKSADMARLGAGPRKVRDTAPASDLRAGYRHILLALPPLTSLHFPMALASVADGAVLLLPWGRVTPDLIRGVLATHGAVLRPIITTLLTAAHTARARLYMRPGDYEERLTHA